MKIEELINLTALMYYGNEEDVKLAERILENLPENEFMKSSYSEFSEEFPHYLPDGTCFYTTFSKNVNGETIYIKILNHEDKDD